MAGRVALALSTGSVPGRGGWTRYCCCPRERCDDAGSRQSGALGKDSPSHPECPSHPSGPTGQQSEKELMAA